MMKTGLVVVSSPPGACACSVPLVLLLQQGRPPVREVSSLLPPVVCWCFLYAASVQSTHSLWGQCGRWQFAPPAEACNAHGFDCGWHPNGSILLGLLFLHLLSLCPCYYLCSSSLPSLCPQEAISEWLVSVAFTEKICSLKTVQGMFNTTKEDPIRNVHPRHGHNISLHHALQHFSWTD